MLELTHLEGQIPGLTTSTQDIDNTTLIKSPSRSRRLKLDRPFDVLPGVDTLAFFPVRFHDAEKNIRTALGGITVQAFRVSVGLESSQT